MFDKIGFKIKLLAKISSLLGMVISVIGGIIVIAFAIELEIGILLAAGIAIIVLGILLSWLSAFLLYGFGELIELNDRNNKLLKLIALSKN